MPFVMIKEKLSSITFIYLCLKNFRKIVAFQRFHGNLGIVWSRQLTEHWFFIHEIKT